MDIRATDLHKLNSITKYPSILTYHEIGERGRLLPKLTQSLQGEELVISEKVDGTNARIILFSEGYLLGSREDLLTYNRDLLHNQAQGIVDGIRATADVLLEKYQPKEGIKVVFGEFFGGKVTSTSKFYTNGDFSLTGFRMFDAFNLDEDKISELLSMEPEEISRWREAGGQPFFSESALMGLGLPVTPRLQAVPPPTSIDGTYNWLKTVIPRSKVTLNYQASGKPEGVVVRTPDRSKIVKIRFEDYERTLRP